MTKASCRYATDRRSEAGVILIALLWILAAMSVIALSFSREGFVEVSAARNAQALEDSYFVARAGIAETTYRLIQKRFVPRVQKLELEGPPGPLELGRVTGEFGGGTYQVDVQDESGKINLNMVAEQQLHSLLTVTGIDEHDADIITDSVMDWRDQDSAYRLNGAESDYYQSLNPPYETKNGRFDAIEELLLVRGMTREYFYGYPERAIDGSIVYKFGLSRYMTVYSTTNLVNVNFAPLPVLMSIPGMAPEAARLIYDRSRIKPFASVGEITRDLPVNLDTTTLPFLSTNQTSTYTLTSCGRRANSKVRRLIRTVISLDTGQRTYYRTLYWNENVPDSEGTTP